jgi:hypothetical protein
MDKQSNRSDQTTPRVSGGESPMLPVRHPVVSEMTHRSVLLNVNVGVEGASVVKKIASGRTISVMNDSPTTTVTFAAPVTRSGEKTAIRMSAAGSVVLKPVAIVGTVVAIVIAAAGA